MSSLPGTASRRAAAAIVLFLLPGCQRRDTPDRPSPPALPAAWSTPQCLVEDVSAPTADTIFVIGPGTQPALASSGSIECDAHRAPPRSAPVVITLEIPAGADLRDILDLGIASASGRRPDVLVTRDPDVLAYARRRGDYLASPLPWTSTYVLLSTRPSAATLIPPASERDALARNAVTADARGATEPFAWLAHPACAFSPEGVTPTIPRSVIAYVSGDATSRQIAERIVSLAAAEPRSGWLDSTIDNRRAGTVRVAAMPADSIRSALAAGQALAAVTSIDRDPRSRCGTRGDVRVHAGAIPLVDTRAHAIIRRGSGAAFLVAPDGSLHFFSRVPR